MKIKRGRIEIEIDTWDMRYLHLETPEQLLAFAETMAAAKLEPPKPGPREVEGFRTKPPTRKQEGKPKKEGR